MTDTENTFEWTSRNIVEELQKLTVRFDIMGASRSQTLTVSILFFDSIKDKVVLHPQFTIWKDSQIIMEIDGYLLTLNKGI